VLTALRQFDYLGLLALWLRRLVDIRCRFHLLAYSRRLLGKALGDDLTPIFRKIV
jgi:hypothetical protein